MSILSKPSSAARTALIYITVGAVLDIWCAVWFAYLNNHAPAGDGAFYWCAGFFVTGLTLIVLGLALGRIGRSARHAELPPPEVTPATVQAEQNAARAPVVVGSPVAPVTPALSSPATVAPGNAPVASAPGLPTGGVIRR